MICGFVISSILRGETTWADFAAAIFAILDQKGMQTPALTPITTADYPTAARGPANSRLDCSKLARQHGVQLPSWRSSLRICLDAMTSEVDRPLRS
jgi:dTDP-4-dehydrorhamnose reductase